MTVFALTIRSRFGFKRCWDDAQESILASDEYWERIESHLPTDVRGVERKDDRRVIGGESTRRLARRRPWPLAGQPAADWSRLFNRDAG